MPVPEEAVRTHAWIFQAMGELIAAAPGLREPPGRERFIRAIQCSLRSVAVSRRAWARQLGVAEGTVLEWRKGRIIPSLWCLLLVGSHLGVSPLQLVCDQLGDVSQTSNGNATPVARPDRPPLTRTPIDRETVRGALEAILASDEVPPPSLREVARRIGQTYRNLHENLPELSGAIAARYRAYQEAQGARTRARLREEIRQAAFQVHQQGHYPNTKRIGALLSRPGSLLNHTARSAWYEALRDLGWRT